MATATPDVAVVVTRQSHLDTGEAPTSTRDQITRAIEGGERHNYVTQPELIFEELGVSGGRTLDKRPGLLPAVEAIEDGQANVLVVTYFDRLARSLVTTENVIERVRAAGGRILALDFGEVSHDTTAEWQSATFAAFQAEAYRRGIGERTHHSRVRAVKAGIPVWRHTPLGFVQQADKTYAVEPKAAKLVVRAFEMRAQGKTIKEIRAMINEAGHVLTYVMVQTLLRNRLYLGELRFGKQGSKTHLENLHFCPAIVDARLFERAQSAKTPRGRQPKSERLLSRLSILRCGTCGSRLGIGSGNGASGTRQATYKCSAQSSDCTRRVSISADVVEDHLLTICEELIEGMEATATWAVELEDSRLALEAAQSTLNVTIRNLASVAGEAEAALVIDEAKAARDEAQANHDRLVSLSVKRSVTVKASELRSLPIEDQRDIVKALIRKATIAPGKAGRVSSVDTIISRIDVDAFAEELIA